MENESARLPSVPEAEETLAAATRELERVLRLDQTLAATLSLLRTAQEQVHRDIAPVLASTVQAWLPELTAGRYARTRLYDAARPAHHALYRTAAWRKLSDEVRANADRCYWCGKGSTRLVADHVIPLSQGPDLALDPSNLRASCVACNVRRASNLG